MLVSGTDRHRRADRKHEQQQRTDADDGPVDQPSGVRLEHPQRPERERTGDPPRHHHADREREGSARASLHDPLDRQVPRAQTERSEHPHVVRRPANSSAHDEDDEEAGPDHDDHTHDPQRQRLEVDCAA